MILRGQGSADGAVGEVHTGYRLRDDAIRSRPGMEYWFVGALTAVSSVLILGFPMVIGMTRGAFDWTPTPGDAIDLGATRVGPNIHVLLLDGYPRSDALDSIGYDNREFLAAMRDRGFDVSDDSLSNYDLTPFSILSMLSMQHVDAVGNLQPQPLPDTVAEQQRIVTRALLDPPIFSALEGAGYRTRLLTANVVLTSIGGAETVWNAGTANNFELDALQRTPLAGILEIWDFAAGQHRAHIQQALEEFAQAPTEPTFTFAHVMTPHAPFVYGSDGAFAGSPPCYPASCQLFHPVPDEVGWSRDEYWRRMGDHIRYVNQLVLEVVDNLIARDPEGVIIVLSDHGMSGKAEVVRFQNLTLVRTPGHPDLLGEAPTLINVIPSILNAYVGSDLPMLPDSRYRTGDGAHWLSLEPVDD